MVVTWTPRFQQYRFPFAPRGVEWLVRQAFHGAGHRRPAAGAAARSGRVHELQPGWPPDCLHRIFSDFRTWKRYDGGLAQNIDIYDFQTKQLKHVTDWVGTETSPMWSGKTIYFLADHAANGAGTYGPMTQAAVSSARSLTSRTMTSISPAWARVRRRASCFSRVASCTCSISRQSNSTDLDVTVPDDGTRTGPRWVDAKPAIREQDTSQHTDFDIAPNGNRAVFSARGDIFTLPAEHGNTRNLTQSSNADEDHPSWSPDGKTVAYTTDISGEQQVAIRPAEGGPEKVLTHFERGFFYGPRWSPNGERLAFSDHEHRLWWMPVAGGEPVQVARDTYAEIHDYTWSPDGRWLAYSINAANLQSGIWLYNIDTKKATLVSDVRSNDFQPAFDPAGKYCSFFSTRHENPTFSRSEFNIATLKTTGIYVARSSAGCLRLLRRSRMRVSVRRKRRSPRRNRSPRLWPKHWPKHWK